MRQKICNPLQKINTNSLHKIVNSFNDIKILWKQGFFKVILMRHIYCFFFLFILPAYSNTKSSQKKLPACYQAFQERQYSSESITNHLTNIQHKNHATPLARTFVKWLDNRNLPSTLKDPAFQGSIIRILGEINRQNKPTMISKLLKISKGKPHHYLERKGAIQALGYLLNPQDKKAIKELSRNLHDRASTIRKETVLALRNIKPKNMPKIERQLMEIASNKSEKIDIRTAAIEALGEIISYNYKTAPLTITTQIPIASLIEAITRYNYRKKMLLRMTEGLTSPVPEIAKATAAALMKVRLKDYTLIQQLKIYELYRQHLDTQIRTAHNHPSPFGSWFEADIFLSIHKRGYFVISDFEVSAGTELSNSSWNLPYRIDFVVFGLDGTKLAIEYDGAKWHPTEEAMEKDLENQEDLESLGWEIFRISEKDFHSFPEETLEGLWNKLNEVKIQPLQPAKS